MNLQRHFIVHRISIYAFPDDICNFCCILLSNNIFGFWVLILHLSSFMGFIWNYYIWNTVFYIYIICFIIDSCISFQFENPFFATFIHAIIFAYKVCNA